MFGRLTYGDLPFYSPIALGGALSEVIAGVVIVGLLLWYRKIGYLFKNWLTSVDHKRIGVMYIVVALVLLLRGFADALMMRTQQVLAVNSEGYLTPDHFDQVYTAHGTIMIFFVAMMFVTGLINIVVPLQIGSRDVAFPLLNSISFYFATTGAALVLLSLVIGKFSAGGWTGYAPFTETAYSPGTGVEYWIWALLISGIGTTLSGVNFITTIMRKRAPGMKLMMMPMFTWTALVASIIMVFGFPPLTAVLALLELDRVYDFHFFTDELGGNPMLFINMLWTWGHPEVYLLILPSFGIYSEIVAIYCRKPIFSYAALVYATAAIGVLSFTVWLHHFFTMGASPAVNAFFSVTTMLISIPTGIKIFNWIYTMYRGRITYGVPMIYTVSFIFNFIVGGMTGVMLALPPVDYLVHNTTFLVAHFHNVIIPGVVFSLLAGMNLWFPKVFGFRLEEKWGRRAAYLWTIGFLLAFMPLYLMGMMGMPRRMQHLDVPEFQPYLDVAEVGVLLILCAVICMAVQLIVSIKNRKELAVLTGDPWNGRTLEWATSSPPPVYNFAIVPKVESLDAYWAMKQKGIAYNLPSAFEDIAVPKNSWFGLLYFVGSLMLGIGYTFYMWWLVDLSVIALVLTTVGMAFRKDTYYVIPAAEVERMERQRLDQQRPLLQARDKQDQQEVAEQLSVAGARS